MLIAGDLSFAEYKNVWQEKEWLFGPFSDWLTAHKIPTIITGGNHDFYIQQNINSLRLSLPCETLENSGAVFNGVKLFGTPYTIEYYDWAYQGTEPEHNVQSPDLVNLNEVFAQDDCVSADIIISHGPPFGVGDQTSRGDRCGSHSLLRHIEQYQPKLVLCGHIHEGYGSYKIGETLVVNCAYVDQNYNARKKIVVVDYDAATNRINGVDVINEPISN